MRSEESWLAGLKDLGLVLPEIVVVPFIPPEIILNTTTADDLERRGPRYAGIPARSEAQRVGDSNAQSRSGRRARWTSDAQRVVSCWRNRGYEVGCNAPGD